MSDIIMRVQMDPEKVEALEKARQALHSAVADLEDKALYFQNAMRRLEFSVKRVDDPDKLHDDFETFYNEDTLLKVYEALRLAGVDANQSPAVVNAMQNKGILFRERA